MSNSYYGNAVPPQDPRSRITQALMAQSNPPPVPPGSMQLPGQMTPPGGALGMPPPQPGMGAPGMQPAALGAAPMGQLGGAIGGQQPGGLALPGLQPPGFGNVKPNF